MRVRQRASSSSRCLIPHEHARQSGLCKGHASLPSPAFLRELRRYDQMKNDLETRKNPDLKAMSKSSINRSTDELDIESEEKPKEMEPPRRRIPELKQRPKSGNWSSFQGSMSASARLGCAFRAAWSTCTPAASCSGNACALARVNGASSTALQAGSMILLSPAQQRCCHFCKKQLCLGAAVVSRTVCTTIDLSVI